MSQTIVIEARMRLLWQDWGGERFILLVDPLVNHLLLPLLLRLSNREFIFDMIIPIKSYYNRKNFLYLRGVVVCDREHLMVVLGCGNDQTSPWSVDLLAEFTLFHSDCHKNLTFQKQETFSNGSNGSMNVEWILDQFEWKDLINSEKFLRFSSLFRYR
ncbi:hypothetical protein PMAYCL1PPCAC_24798 [Pristionchus mayeri]|uniref:Uncharacterized protein n=1 Tax=Pristionchus mayeri TaxID=1317129 RepID=A0AAN5I8Y9_9BILA|nr:hypothetical protein PMAYCL1PPCAC_24794 [Pristionchus mayeri]GMR54600.1 hypothetical protein PMAYCL1PPCAC_24795 [Pristionchus mayeri]GMR54601.1 hypothetical protein PMAYCL1PPCAC_24796 [Pristionchus mayeri]GMR54602.1 hypothetical protein PMAYCL1PPCAC_24797 [Pristionchus mayeri]GMR54603.1 hypothetical protein PMAYCL1PPCAC_24798 [Pristionchus mayeri]